MKLYYAQGACSLASHIALIEAGLEFDIEAVDLHAKRTASGGDYLKINPRGYVPALTFDGGEAVTESIALLDWIAQHKPSLQPSGPLGRTRQLEMLSFIESDIHHAFKPMWHEGSEAELRAASEKVAGCLQFAATRMRGDYLFGDEFCAADGFLFVMLRWADKFGVAVPDALLRLRRQVARRPAVEAAIRSEEGEAPHRSSAELAEVIDS